MDSYYHIPLRLNKITSNENLQKADLARSIADYIYLIITTRFGECSFDESFGCYIWNVDFDNLTSTHKLRDLISESIAENIVEKERRLKKTEVKVSIRQEELKEEQKSTRIKKRVDIKINGLIKKTNEPFSTIESFYIAPFSY